METAHTDSGEESEEGAAAMIEGVFKKACNDFDFFGCSQFPKNKDRTHPDNTHARAPMTLTEILRKSCAANNLGTTGSSATAL